MLQVKNIFKKYVTGDLVQTALNDVSLNLRDNEFVAILGQSGSGKTTLLNVIGGLDRYDSGDLIINGISTKDYNDRDWDSYRNHTIGFVFQSYNLIPHQTILSNVELALTISGISGKERKERAIQALKEVGLGNQLHKKPNQMSGGQMQRVAIARALVNNPDILLADEPTGALDSETSVQVMDLLKEVAKDRLVVMVTHNPELAEEYATRIVRLKDGKIIDDSNPFIIDDSKMEPPKHQNMGKASMSFMTSLALSFNNLKTKKGRTFLTSFAGSIGIIGIALILSLSNGVNTYIHNVEEETLSEYPLTIQTADVDISSMIQVAASASVDEDAGEEVNERQTISSFFSQAKKNDLKSLKEYLESGESDIYDHARAIEYSYGVTPHIYRLMDDDYRQVNPNQSFKELSGGYGMMSNSMAYNVFRSLPEHDDLYKEQYDVLAGKWPENTHELVVVLSPDNCVTDILLYSTGLKDPNELDDIIKRYKNGEQDIEVGEQSKYKYDDFLGIQFKLVDVSKEYTYDAEHKVYIDKTDDMNYMLDIIGKGDTLEIVGVVKPNDSKKAAMLSQGILYPYELEKEVILEASNSEIVKKQMENPEKDVFTGKKFDDDSKDSNNSLFSVDEKAIQNAFKINTSGFNMGGDLFSGMDFSNIKIDFSNMKFDIKGLENVDFSKLLSNINIEINKDGFEKLFNAVLNSYLQYAANDPSTDYAKLPDAMQTYFDSGRAYAIIQKDINDILNKYSKQLPDAASTSALVQDIMQGFGAYLLTIPDVDVNQISSYLNAYLNSSEVQAEIAQYAAGFDLSDISSADIQMIMNHLLTDYQDYAKTNNLPDPSKMQASFRDFVQSDVGRQAIENGLNQVVNMEDLEKQFGNLLKEAMVQFSGAFGNQMSEVMSQAMSQIVSQLGSSMGSVMQRLSSAMTNMFSFDQKAFAKAFNMNMDEKQMQELMMSMMNNGRASYDGNLQKLNYYDLDVPGAISIYPKDFDNKTAIINILNKYNKKMEKSGQEDKVVSFTDYVATLMSSVTDIIDTISYVLIAFVAISLVVSSIMIGIITYISVLERTKEIGILRAIGASKRNVSQVFNAETFIIGLLAGVLGIIITLILLIPGNMLIHHLTDGNEVNAILPFAGAIILIIISVILTLIGGIIPSRAAAKKDPVTALRSE